MTTDNGFVPATRDDDALPDDLASPRRPVTDRLAPVLVGLLALATLAFAAYGFTLIS